mmetsp:Transcript_15656/g.16398  ORF Transcript_15656/g.16398 Transcript_15656/m.16398 type:complete len:172 (+) Transcript_15656:45-560(+)
MNNSKVFVGNLPFSIRSSDLEELFGPFGEIIGVNIREDRATGRPRGFAFVTFSNESSAEESIKSLNGFNYNGRVLTVNLATLRGSENQKNIVDNSWKTAPPPPRSSSSSTNTSTNNNTTTTSSSSKNGSKNETKQNHQKKSWTTWASPTQLPNTTNPSKSTTTSASTKINR